MSSQEEAAADLSEVGGAGGVLGLIGFQHKVMGLGYKVVRVWGPRYRVCERAFLFCQGCAR